MKRSLILFILFLFVFNLTGQQEPLKENGRFAVYDLFIESPVQLAAWQAEFYYSAGVKISGIE